MTPAECQHPFTRLSQRDLSATHHALRLAVKYPGLSSEAREETTRLADIAWDECVRRIVQEAEVNPDMLRART